MVRHVDTSRTVMKEEVYTHRSLDIGGMTCHAGGHMGKQENIWPKALTVVAMGRNGYSRVRRLWGIGVVPSYLTPGPRVIKQKNSAAWNIRTT